MYENCLSVAFLMLIKKLHCDKICTTESWFFPDTYSAQERVLIWAQNASRPKPVWKVRDPPNTALPLIPCGNHPSPEQRSCPSQVSDGHLSWGLILPWAWLLFLLLLFPYHHQFKPITFCSILHPSLCFAGLLSPQKLFLKILSKFWLSSQAIWLYCSL